MSDNHTLVDFATLSILAELHESRGLRYVDLKSRLRKDKVILSDSTLTNRLNILKTYHLVTVEASIVTDGRNQILYKLSTTGSKIVKDLSILSFLKKVNEFTPKLSELPDSKNAPL